MQAYRAPAERPLGRALSQHRASSTKRASELAFPVILMLMGVAFASPLHAVPSSPARSSCPSRSR